MILILLPLISFFHLSFCNNRETETRETTPRPPEAIKVRGGDILGHNLTFPEGNVTEYLGIPFAQPPYGYHRFLPPTELEDTQWNGTRECVTIANSCMQLLINDTFEGYNYTNPRKNISEDCLQLNMWVPEHKNGTTVVFLFGDSFSYGSPSLDLNNGSVLALKSGSIIINLNYRLSIFGFAYLGEDSRVKGNMGLLDQQMGLKWINENIHLFGGSNKSITIYGSSAGATSVTAHLFSTNSSKLFNKAVVASGAVTNIWSTNTQEMALNFTMSVAKVLNCTNETRTDKEKTTIPIILKEMHKNESEVDEKTKILVCLQNKTTDEIIAVVYGVYNETIHGTKNETVDEVMYSIEEPQMYPFVPMDNDTVFFNGSLWQKKNESDLKKDADIVFGRVQDEATYLMPDMLKDLGCTFNSTLQTLRNRLETSGSKINETIKGKSNRCLLSEAGYYLSTIMVGGALGNIDDDFISKLMEIYDSTNTTLPRGKVAEMLSDFFIDCRLAEFAEYYYNANSSNNVYFYEYRKRSVINPWPKWMGAMHTWELEPIFGYPIRHPELYNKTKETEEVTEVRRKRQTTEATPNTIMKPNVTFEQLFSNISMNTVGDFSSSGNPGDIWLKYNDTVKKGLVISGNLSEIKYINPISSRCKNLTALIQEFEEKMKQKTQESETQTSV
uniref:Carboxylic ester hydrolase n=1 Tax=Strongyloides papillosus TaxID=174720 RepID=A0A0N5CHF6_STREA